MFFPLITSPTRIAANKASLIDNIFTNDPLRPSISGLFINDISDHLPIFSFILYNAGPYLGFFVCGGKLGFREISDQYSYKKQPSKIRHYVRKKTFSFPGGGNCPLRPPAMYGPAMGPPLPAGNDFTQLSKFAY